MERTSSSRLLSPLPLENGGHSGLGSRRRAIEIGGVLAPIAFVERERHRAADEFGVTAVDDVVGELDAGAIGRRA